MASEPPLSNSETVSPREDLADVPPACPEPAPEAPKTAHDDTRYLDASIARLFAAGQTYSQVAETLRISRSTVARRLADPTMKRRVRVLVDMRVSDIVADLSGASSSAILLLQRVVMDNGSTDAVRVRAADSILQHLGRFTLRSPHDPATVAEAREALVVRLQEMARRKADGTPLVDAYLNDTEPEHHNNEQEVPADDHQE